MEDLSIDGRMKIGFKGTFEVLRLNSRQDKRFFLTQNLQPILRHNLSRLMCPCGICCGVQAVGREFVYVRLSIVKVNTLRTGDADLRFYITNVQGG